MPARRFLRAEGLAVFIAAVAGFLWLDGSLWLFLLLILAPDLSMIGYLAGPRWGARSYNVVHTYVGPLALIGGAIWVGLPLGILVGLVWAAHIGADRALGYGLKEPSGFKDTHLGPLGGRRKPEGTADPVDPEAGI